MDSICCFNGQNPGEKNLRHQNVAEVLFATDLRKQESCVQFLDDLTVRGVIIDVLFNNAGFGTNGEFCDLEITSQLQMIDLNCKSLVSLSHLVGNQMRKGRSGAIIHTASLGGLAPTPYYAVYGATKAFVISFSEAIGE